MQKRIVLQEGEVTGHAHAAVGDDIALTTKNDARFLDAPSGAVVTHEEHNNVQLPPGEWRVNRINEYDHFAEEARQVND